MGERILRAVNFCFTALLAAAATYFLIGRIDGTNPRASSDAYQTEGLPRELVPLGGLALRGAPSARVGLILFSDLECLPCRELAGGVLKTLEARYVDTGRLVMSFRELGAGKSGGGSLAKAAACAAEQSQYWEMHDVLLRHPSTLQRGDIIAVGSKVVPSRAAFEDCMWRTDVPEDRETRQWAEALAITGTPSAVIGRTEGDRSIRVTSIVRGSQSEDLFVRAIERAEGR